MKVASVLQISGRSGLATSTGSRETGTERPSYACLSQELLKEAQGSKGGTRLAEELGSGLRKIPQMKQRNNWSFPAAPFMAQGPPPPLAIVSKPSQGRSFLPNQTPSRSVVGQWGIPTSREAMVSTR
ncbi:hypothetical protein AnigIFM56816_003402 [Aspergillus niger]|nr:hypothetical protein AnigIFM56816_003402 [Aspergillus niger]